MKISINKESPVTVRNQLIEQIGLQIASGTLKGNEKLPSIRALAQRLGIHPSTVTSAYNHLSEVGLLDIRQGSGVRVAIPPYVNPNEAGENKPDIQVLFKNFLAQIANAGYSRQDLTKCFKFFDNRESLERILVIDRNKDFHQLLSYELQPYFKLPVEITTYEELTQKTNILANSLIVTSLYHVFALQNLDIDPTRFVVCNIEPAQQEIETILQVPATSIVMIVSCSPTLLKMATNIIAAVRGEEIAVRTILLDDEKELSYMTKYAKVIICDLVSKDKVMSLAGKVPVNVFKLFAQTTIDTISHRIDKWG